MDAVSSNGRGPHGHFAKGHRFSQNNRKSMRLRWAVLRAVTPADVLEILEGQLAKAKEGDTKAAAFVYDRVIGKPVSPVEVSGSGGAPLGGITLEAVTVVILECLPPAERVRVAERLRRLQAGGAVGEGEECPQS
jgi:hypothetical protein